MTKITYSELMEELEKYVAPPRGNNGRIFTKEQNKFLKLAHKKNMSTRVIKEWWERAGWTPIGRESIAKRIKELSNT